MPGAKAGGRSKSGGLDGFVYFAELEYSSCEGALL